MPTKYKVKKNETLAIISKDYGFNNINTIIEANKESWPYLSLHHNVLIEGMTIVIPDIKAKKVDQRTSTEVIYTALRPYKQQLCLSLDNGAGEIKSVMDEVTLLINGRSVPFIDNSDYSSGSVTSTILIVTKDPLPDGVITNSSLKLKFRSLFNHKVIENEIKLDIGGLDPIISPDFRNDGKETDNIAPKKAIQKILANLGYYYSEIDGDLSSSASVVAISMFQNDFMNEDQINGEYGIANENTCYFLTFQQGNSMGPIQKIKT